MGAVMAPKRKIVPLDDIKGLKTLRDENWSHESMAAYYSEKMQVPYSRRTIERWLLILEERENAN